MSFSAKIVNGIDKSYRFESVNSSLFANCYWRAALLYYSITHLFDDKNAAC